MNGATGYRLDVATNNSFTNYVTGYQNLNVGNALSRSVAGLSPSTTYYCRVRAYNGNGTSGNSNVVSVTTLPPTGRPVVITNPATLIMSNSAKLNGAVDPHGLSTTVYFQYGRTISYGSRTPNQTKTGNIYQNVSANLLGLTRTLRIISGSWAPTPPAPDTAAIERSSHGCIKDVHRARMVPLRASVSIRGGIASSPTTVTRGPNLCPSMEQAR